MQKSKNNNQVVIKVNKLTKTFHEQAGSKSFKEAFVNIGRKITGKKEKKTHKGDFTALKDINFEIKKGEFFGIVGRNGSGKSTLLKLLAGVYTPSDGEIGITGNLTPFIELGVGFNPELSGRDNVFLNGALLGFTRKQMEAMYDDIVEFAELKEFMDTKLKNYSSGMQVRLAFSVAIRADSDILLIDEVLAVGDAAFQQKCFTYFEQLKRNSKTIVFVTHDMAAVKQFCNRALYLDNSKVLKIGSPQVVADIYEKKNFEAITKNSGTIDTDIMLLEVFSNSKLTNKIKAGGDITISMDWSKIKSRISIIGCVIKNQGQVVFATNSLNQINVSTIKKAKLTFPKLELGDGRYTISIGVFGVDRYDLLAMYQDIESFTIYGNSLKGKNNDEWSGTTYIDNNWS